MDNIRINNTMQGYLWMSDQDAPYVYDKGTISKDEKECSHAPFDLDFSKAQNPFIVEGQLYDETQGISYSIKFVDGKYLVKIYQVDNADLHKTTVEVKEYLSNRMGDRWLRFLRYWEEDIEDECVRNMPVLKLQKEVFIKQIK